MAYDYKRWRSLTAEVCALAESSDNESENPQQLEHTQDTTGPQQSGEDQEQSTHTGNDLVAEIDDYESDCNYVESSDSDSGGIGSENEDVEETPVIHEQLIEWANKNKCTRSGLNELLAILRTHGHDLPKDARTLLRTPRVIESIEKCGGQYAYFGIEAGIIKHLDLTMISNDCIDLSVNIDGVPLFKSSNVQLWPILCSVSNQSPFLVALFSGTTKPTSVSVFLEDFLTEYAHLKENKLLYNDTQYTVSIRAFVCDAPARAFLKCIKSHSGYFSCERCEAKGQWNGRVVFHDNNSFTSTHRTDDKFNNQQYEMHQNARSPLIDAGIQCITSFPLDYMHLVCLGVMKRILLFLKQGPKECKLSFRHISEISDSLESLAGQMPSEFARQPRSLSEIERWKATEFRQFLLYTGPLVLHGVLSNNVYNHFLMLTVIMSILLNTNNAERNHYLCYAEELLLHFVRKCKDIYGETFTVYNVHNLLHLPDDVKHFGCSLNEISAFQFENHLHTLKKFVRKSQNPIAQVTKRISELDKTYVTRRCKRISQTRIGIRRKDSCFLLGNEDIAFVKEKRQDGSLVCDLFKMRTMQSLFETPCDSKLINVTYIRCLRNEARRSILSKEALQKKCVCLPHNGGYAVFPMLHDIERH